MERTPRMLVDAHAHLDLLKNAPEELRKARSMGVIAVIGVSMGAESMKETILLKEELPDIVLAALGLHPWQIDREDASEALGRLEEDVRHAAAIGEIGLDYRIKTSRSLQRELFEKQLRLARDKALPVIVHCRYSHERAFKMVVEMEVPQAVFHWYTGPLELIEAIVERGFFVSATPALAYSPKHQEAVRSAPLENILLETDSPVDYQGEEATPSSLIRVCEQVASLKGCSPDEVAWQTTENVKRFLGEAWADRLGSRILANATSG
jgi:TatD DNase family protein